MLKKAIIPAAGSGTRFLPLTKAQPKEMLPIIDTPTIQYVIEEALAADIQDILIVTGRGKRVIEDHFDHSFELESQLKQKGKMELLEQVQQIATLANIHYIRQKNQNGLGDAIMYGERHVSNEPFAVLLGDSVNTGPKPCIAQLADIHYRFGASVIAVQEVPPDKVHRYGIIKGKRIEKDLYLIEDLIEKPDPAEAPSNLAIAGRYVFNPEIFGFLHQTPPGKNGEVQITDAIRKMVKKNAVFAYKFEGKRYDIGNKIEFLKTNIDFAMMRTEFKDDILDYLRDVVARYDKAVKSQ